MTQPNWQPAEQHPAPPDSVLLDWLTDEGSLTLRLTAAGDDDFRVDVLSQCRQPARGDEANVLGLEVGEPVWVREVLLHTAGAPRVFARTVAPLTALAHDGIDLQNVGNRSLGLQLFSNPRVSRGKLEISRYPAAWLPVVWRTPDCWARRSLFSEGPLLLLVCEVFLAGWPTS